MTRSTRSSRAQRACKWARSSVSMHGNLAAGLAPGGPGNSPANARNAAQGGPGVGWGLAP
jgi:hypothetical protein